MVRLKSEYMNQHPSFYTWLRQEFVHVASKPRVMKAFWKWSAFSESLWTRAFFQYGSEPAIVVADFPCDYADTDPSNRSKSTMTELIGMALVLLR